MLLPGEVVMKDLAAVMATAQPGGHGQIGRLLLKVQWKMAVVSASRTQLICGRQPLRPQVKIAKYVQELSGSGTAR
jgi:hypothetical protein